MRLIDADKIVFTNCLVKSGLRVCCHNEGIVPKESIEMQPTVKAITIEWIKEQVADGYYDICEIMYHWERENNIKENILFGGVNDWEKENEIN